MRTRQLELNQATTVTVFEPHDTQFSGRDVWNIIFTKLSSPSLFLKKSAMAPKNQKGSSSNKQKPQEEEREDSLQAVVGFIPPRLEKKTHTNACTDSCRFLRNEVQTIYSRKAEGTFFDLG